MSEQEKLSNFEEQMGKITLFVFAGDLYKVLGAFVIATGAVGVATALASSSESKTSLFIS